jgi:hypothetical protein
LEGLVEEAALLQGELGRLMELGDAGGLGSMLVLRAAKMRRCRADARDDGADRFSGGYPRLRQYHLWLEEHESRMALGL